MLHRSILALLFLAPTLAFAAPPKVPDLAFAAGAMDNAGKTHAEARLILDHTRLQSGSTFRIGILLSLDDGWHAYWHNPGESALPSQIDWFATAATFGALQWPAPTGFAEMDGELLTFGYADEVLLFAPATVSENASGTLSVGATFKFLVCKDICVPFTGTIQRDIDIGGVTHSDESAYFERYATLVPPAAEVAGLRLSAEIQSVPVGAKAPFAATLWVDPCAGGNRETCADISFGSDLKQVFFHHLIKGLGMRVMSATPAADESKAWRIDLAGMSGRSFDADKVERFGGVLSYVNALGQPASAEFSLPFVYDPAALTSTAPGEAADDDIASAQAAPPLPLPMPFWQVLLFSLLGGLILNVMPCVFPVLGIKVAAFTLLVHGQRSHILPHAVAYTAGIVGAMLVLAASVIALKSAGTAVGWGFQFQNPRFVVTLIAIVVIFALNLFGVFQIGIASAAATEKTENLRGLGRSLGEGVLAVILATPCSAPFLGTALGFAFAASNATIVAVFVTIGLGLASPFVLLSLTPGADKWLPKPGHWMDVFKQFLAFLLLATAIWLLAVLGAQTGSDGIVRALVFLLVLSYALWTFGRVQYRHGLRKWLPIVVVLALSIWAGRPAYTLARQTQTGMAADALGAPYSAAAVEAALAAGQPVFVDFTADWCITCKVNERTVLRSARVQELFSRYNVRVLVADWTNDDPEIRAVLERYGRAGVPMYLLYRPGQAQAQVLPEVITAGIIEAALKGG